MTPHLRSAAAMLLCALAATAAASPADAARARSVTERVFAFGPGGTLVIDSQNGRIVVEAWERPEVRVQITREVRANGEDQARSLLRQLTADVSVTPRRIRIESVYPKREKVVGIWDLIGRGVRSLNIHYYVQVPRQTLLDLSTDNGEIRVRGTQGQSELMTTNGDIDVISVRGPVEARTTNGEIRMARVEGSAEAATTNGGVAAEMTSLPAGGVLDLRTTNGNVQLTLPHDIRAVVEANTTNGRVTINYKMTMQGAITSKSIRGTIGGGGARIKLETANGNVDVGPPRARAKR